MRIIPLSEGMFTVDATKKFIPFDKEQHKLQDRPRGSLLVEIQPFCVVTEKDIIVIDTGLGFYTEKGLLQIHQNLLGHHIQPEDVTKVLLSHLHKDHAGGLFLHGDEAKPGTLSFPSAQYFINRNEYEFALEKGYPSYQTDHYQSLSQSKQVTFLEGDGIIDDTIHYSISGGHAPFHQVFRMEEKGSVVFFGGDVAPQLQQMKNRFIAKYDYDGRKSMELRRSWWEQAMQNHWTFLFYHDIKTPYLMC